MSTVLAFLVLMGGGTARSERVSEALAEALRGTQAAGVVMEARTGKVMAQAGAVERRARPGSAVKPFFLEYGVEHGMVTARTEVLCRRDLRVGGRRLPCTHPAGRDVFSAETALAESCNTYFAELGRRLSGRDVEAALREAGFAHEALVGDAVEARELTVLGLRGVAVSAMDLARAYRGLAARLPVDGPVWRGLRGSVLYGMANGAAVPGIVILGKTGTASEAGEAWTHGWFAGVLPGRMVVVVFVPRGDGGTAARLAGVFFRRLQAGGGAE